MLFSCLALFISFSFSISGSSVFEINFWIRTKRP
jgi:hypothetical protein